MTIAAALALSLLSSSLGPPASRALPAVAAVDSPAWALVHAGQLWLCWRPGPRCFERVELEGLDASARPSTSEDLAEVEHSALSASPSPSPSLGRDGAWRLGFAGSTLWIVLDEQRWRVGAGQRRASATEAVPPVQLHRPRLHGCGPTGQVPALVQGSLDWQAAPTCSAAPTGERCLGPAGPRLRRPLPLRVRVGLELERTIGWSVLAAASQARGEDSAALERRASSSLLAFVELEFDLGRALRQRASRSGRHAAAALRQLPAVTDGPLAARERAALRELLCASAEVPR